MAVETKWLTVLATPLTADGTQFGVVTVADTTGFKVKGFAYLVANSLPPLEVQVQRVLSKTQMIVGKPRTVPSPANFIDVSAYTVAGSAQIGFAEQSKNKIKPDDIQQSTYESDPTVAWRNVLVDQYGNFYTPDNPFPIVFDGTISIGKVEVVGENGNVIEPNPDGSINVNVVSIPTAGNVVKNQYGEANSVASGSTVAVVQYIAPISITSAVLQRISVSGENIAKWTVFINATQIDTRRTFYGSSLSEYFEFTTGGSDGVVLNPGDQVIVNVVHNRPYVGDFEGRIQVLEIS